jgi:hypothetical protein
MQDCYDSLASDIPPDPLESCTSEMMIDDEMDNDNKREAIEPFLAEEMSEIASILGDTFYPLQHNDFTLEYNYPISLDKVRSQGAHNCGFDLVKAPFVVSSEYNLISVNNDTKSSTNIDDAIVGGYQETHDNMMLTHRRLFQLIFGSCTQQLPKVHKA